MNVWEEAAVVGTDSFLVEAVGESLDRDLVASISFAPFGSVSEAEQ